jgi:hypothetical protein
MAWRGGWVEDIHCSLCRGSESRMMVKEIKLDFEFLFAGDF